jgi:hypothetical protein
MLALTDQLTWHAVPVSDFEDICFVQVYVVLVLSLYCCCFISWFSIVSNILILHCLKYLDPPLSQVSWSSIVSSILYGGSRYLRQWRIKILETMEDQDTWDNGGSRYLRQWRIKIFETMEDQDTWDNGGSRYLRQWRIKIVSWSSIVSSILILHCLKYLFYIAYPEFVFLSNINRKQFLSFIYLTML